MPLNPNAAIEITAFRWVPEFAQGVVRDLRARWALEEAGLDYRVRLLDQQRPPEYLKEQPFDQVPCFSDGKVQIFESGAIVQYIGEKSEVLLPRDPQGKYRAIQWTYAALNSVEPAIINLLLIDVFFTDEEWAKLRRPGAERFRQAEAEARVRLARRQGVARGRPLHHRRPDDGHDAALPAPHRPRRRIPQSRCLPETRRSAPRIPARARRPARRRSASTEPEGAAA